MPLERPAVGSYAGLPLVRRRALVTGANRGIGRQVALELAARGLQVIVAARQLSAAKETAAAIHERGDSAEAIEIDVSDSASIAAAAREYAERFERLDVLVNNAGVYLDKGYAAPTVPRKIARTTFDVNTIGPLEMVQQFLPSLRKSGEARVINVSSGYGALDGLSSEATSYCLSKLALNGATIILAQALAADGIAVNSACPGWVRTDMGGAEATRSVEEGAAGTVWLATEAEQSLTGKFFRDGQEISW
jgi:NAD(P)-dependent dehydrogenase (short-subunit alcohol dehydrogenase family)